MAREFYGYFDSVSSDPRSYTADQFAEIFRAIARDGTQDTADSLKVIPQGSTMAVTIQPGRCLIHGYVYALINDGGAVKTLAVSPAGAAPRIDLVVARLSLGTGTGQRIISLAVKEGTPGSSPTAPTVTVTSTVREMALAAIRVNPSATQIKPEDILDLRQAVTTGGAAEHTHGAATPSTPGFLPAADKSYLDNLRQAVTPKADGIDLGGRYIDNALFR